jgi:hypothetical protein
MDFESFAEQVLVTVTKQLGVGWWDENDDTCLFSVAIVLYLLLNIRAVQSLLKYGTVDVLLYSS